MGNNRTFIGAFGFVLALLLITIAMIVPTIFNRPASELQFQLGLIFICGALSGVGIGGVISRPGGGQKADPVDLIMGGGGLAGAFVLAFWFGVVDAASVDAMRVWTSLLSGGVALLSAMLIVASWDT